MWHLRARVCACVCVRLCVSVRAHACACVLVNHSNTTRQHSTHSATFPFSRNELCLMPIEGAKRRISKTWTKYRSFVLFVNIGRLTWQTYSARGYNLERSDGHKHTRHLIFLSIHLFQTYPVSSRAEFSKSNYGAFDVARDFARHFK